MGTLHKYTKKLSTTGSFKKIYLIGFFHFQDYIWRIEEKEQDSELK